jgi:hypothetical protein
VFGSLNYEYDDVVVLGGGLGVNAMVVSDGGSFSASIPTMLSKAIELP